MPSAMVMTTSKRLSKSPLTLVWCGSAVRVMKYPKISAKKMIESIAPLSVSDAAMLLGIIRLMTSMKLASGLAPAAVSGESPRVAPSPGRMMFTSSCPTMIAKTLVAT